MMIWKIFSKFNLFLRSIRLKTTKFRALCIFLIYSFITPQKSQTLLNEYLKSVMIIGILESLIFFLKVNNLVVALKSSRLTKNLILVALNLLFKSCG